MDISFRCHEQDNFKRKTQSVRAFSYKEYSIDPHVHDFYEMNIVIHGTGIHTVGDSSLSVRRGDVFVIPPSTVHSYSNTGHLEVYHLLLRADFVRHELSFDVPGMIQLFEIEPFLRRNCSEAMFLRLTPPELSLVERELVFVEDGSEFDNPSFELIGLHTVAKLVYYLSYLLSKRIGEREEVPEAKYRPQILDTLEYISRHFNEKLTVNSLAERVYLSRSTFLRNFEAVCGCTPGKYIMDYRVRAAIELMRDKDMSKTEIAHFCGFFDLSHMERSTRGMR